MRRSAAVWLVALVACGGNDENLSAPTGSLEISTTTSGQPATESFTVLVDGGQPTSIGINATLTLAAETGTHTVELVGLPNGCSVSGDNPRSVTISAGAVVAVSFTITCTAPPAQTGTLQVSTVTTGSDPDGYQLSLDAGPGQPIGINASITLSNIAVGDHMIGLSGIDAPCTLAGENPRSVTITAGATANVQFSIGCGAPPPTSSRIAFNSNAVGLQAVFVVNPDGTGLTNLTPSGAFDVNPVWSPDGTKILFGSNDDLYVMNADGSSRVKLVDGAGIFTYRWSHDGSRIAFIAERTAGADIFEDLWVMNADGSGQLKLASNAVDPTWSPDGLRIVFASTTAGDQQLHEINADGSGDTPLTVEPMRAAQPAWSPDGTKIAFVSVLEKDIQLINPDGTGLVNLTQGSALDDSPVWSPDGSRVAFNTGPADQPLESDVAVINREGGDPSNLTHRPGFDFNPDWSPDGSKIVFTRSDGGDSEIYTMNEDGSAQTDISQRPNALDTSPDWGGQPPILAAGRFSRAFSARLWRWDQTPR
jgi:Tol biopolymer transport system component